MGGIERGRLVLSDFSFIFSGSFASFFLFSVLSYLQGTSPLCVPDCPLKTMTVQVTTSGSTLFKPFPRGRCDPPGHQPFLGVLVLSVGFCAEVGLVCALAGLPSPLLFTVTEALPHSVPGSCSDSRRLSHWHLFLHFHIVACLWHYSGNAGDYELVWFCLQLWGIHGF